MDQTKMIIAKEIDCYDPDISLVATLWHFIENPGSSEEFFELRARVREHGNLHDCAPALLRALKLAITAINNTPSFNTGIKDPANPRRTLSSYTLIPALEATVRNAVGHQ